MNRFIDQTWVIVPAYNEEACISSTIHSILHYMPNVVVVDDCSCDATSHVSLDAGVHVLRHPINLGQGAALQTGFDYALRNGAKYIVSFDADGQHKAEEIVPMLQALISNNVEVALGSRFLGKTLNIPQSRRRLLKLAILFTRLTSGGNFTDVHNGFRIMTRSFLTKFRFKQDRMAHASEILTYIAKQDIPYMEFPVTIAYTAYSVEKGQRNSHLIKVLLELVGGFFSK